MNIIKLIDSIIPEDPFFNENLKGKYAYYIQCKYIVPLESITQDDYINYERDEKREFLNLIEYRDVEDLVNYIDVTETENINNIKKYLLLNEFTSDDDITIDELKQFRKWLATTLLKFDTDLYGQPIYNVYDEATYHMLSYYANDMEDEITKYLRIFGTSTVQLTTSTSSCGCGSVGSFGGVTVQTPQIAALQTHKCGCGDANASLYSLGNVSHCDPLDTYRRNIYLKMVTTFSEIDFWTQFNKTLIIEFKKYVDNIIKNNFTLVTNDYITSFADCSCLNEKDAEQHKNMGILKNLSKSLGYIVDDDISGHRNFISDALTGWSSLLYEKMRWS